jgi:hypothetical protein
MAKVRRIALGPWRRSLRPLNGRAWPCHSRAVFELKESPRVRGPIDRAKCVCPLVALALGLVGLGCGRTEENRRAGVASAAPASSQRVATKATVVVASAPSATASSPPPPPVPASPVSACPDRDAAVARAHKAALASRWEDAITNLDAALRARPADAQVRAERGYAYLKQGAPARARIDLLDALTLTRKRPLMAQIWYNLGLVGKAMGNPSEQRLAFAIAHHHGSKAALSELGDASPCAATWRVRPAGKIPVAFGWEELGEQRR